MVIYDSLNVLVSWHLCPGRIVSRHCIWIYIDDLAISFVLEKQAFLILSNYLQRRMQVNHRR